MRSPMIWQMPDSNKGMILIEPQPLDVIDQHWQIEDSTPESGGILLGYRRESHLHVIAATVPQVADRRHRFGFSRSSRHHQEIAYQKWISSDEMVDYLGEWHTHPETDPHPSSLDLSEWRKICRLNQLPMIFMIIGWSGNIWIGKTEGEEILQYKQAVDISWTSS